MREGEGEGGSSQKTRDGRVVSDRFLAQIGVELKSRSLQTTLIKVPKVRVLFLQHLQSALQEVVVAFLYQFEGFADLGSDGTAFAHDT